MHCKEICLVIIIFVLSCLSLLSGLATLLFGIGAQFMSNSVDFFGSAVVKVAIGESAYLWIALGAMTIFISIFGCCSACCTSRGIFSTYAIVMFLLSMGDIYLAVAVKSSIATELSRVAQRPEVSYVFVFCLSMMAVIKLFGVLTASVAAFQFKPKYHRMDEMQQKLIITSNTSFTPHSSNYPPDNYYNERGLNSTLPRNSQNLEEFQLGPEESQA